jgi:hypothetical protein
MVARNRIGIDLRCKMSAGSNQAMKRIAAFLLLVALSPAWATPTKRENTRIGENAREARRAAKQNRRSVNKSARKQRKQMKKIQKAQRKLAKRSQHRRR